MTKNEAWFLSLDRESYKNLCQRWNEQHISVKIPELDGYDKWLDFFRKLSPTEIENLYEYGKDVLNTEAYAALARWKDIIATPGRIDKIYQAGLTKPKTEQKTISELAAENDELGVLMACRDQIAEQLERGTGARDTASLAMSMSNIIQQIKDAERRAGPKKDTVLAQILGDMAKLCKLFNLFVKLVFLVEVALKNIKAQFLKLVYSAEILAVCLCSRYL